MTYIEAVVPACIEMWQEGFIELDSSSDWGFEYTDKWDFWNDKAIEDRAAKIAGKQTNANWNEFCNEAKRAAKIIANAPLLKALE